MDALTVIAMLAQAVELYLVENADFIAWERRHAELMGLRRRKCRPDSREFRREDRP